MLDQVDVDAPDQKSEMTFLDHLEELRWHIVRSLIALLVLTIVAFVAKDLVFGIIEGPSKTDFVTYRWLCGLVETYDLTERLCISEMGFTLMNMSMAGQFTQHIFISFAAGFVFCFPYLFWEFWRFIKPALSKKEKRSARGLVFYSSFLFILGVGMGYFILAPISIQFLGSYRLSDSIQNTIMLKNYISTLVMIILSCSLVFELPMVVYFLSKAGLITPSIMKKYRKHSFVVVLILSAVITPPDIMSQLLLTIPFFVLYEISIGISARIFRRRV